MTAGVLVAMFDALPLNGAATSRQNRRYAALATGALALPIDAKRRLSAR